MHEDFRISLAQERHDAKQYPQPEFDDSDYWYEFYKDERELAKGEGRQWEK